MQGVPRVSAGAPGGARQDGVGFFRVACGNDETAPTRDTTHPRCDQADSPVCGEVSSACFAAVAQVLRELPDLGDDPARDVSGEPSTKASGRSRERSNYGAPAGKVTSCCEGLGTLFRAIDPCCRVGAQEGRKEGEIDVGRAGRARCGEERAEVGAVHAALARMEPRPDLLELGGDPPDESEAPGLNCIDASIPRYWKGGNHQRRASSRRRRQGRRLPPVSGSPSRPIQVCLLRAAWILT